MNKCGAHTRIPNHSSECGKQKKNRIPNKIRRRRLKWGSGLISSFFAFSERMAQKKKVLDPEQNEAPASDVGFGNYGRFISSSHINVGRKFLDIVYTRISNPSSGAGAWCDWGTGDVVLLGASKGRAFCRLCSFPAGSRIKSGAGAWRGVPDSGILSQIFLREAN